MILTAIQIFYYSLVTIIILFLLGYGLSVLFMPKGIKPYVFWLIPWFAIVFLIFSLILLSLSGLNVRQSSPLIIFLFTSLTIYAALKKRIISIDYKEGVIVLIYIVFALFFNLRPVIFHDQFLTSISFGNNDGITYIEACEFLVNHTITEGMNKNAPMPVRNLFVNDYRWGPTILTAFFINLFGLPSYQFFYLFLVIIFILFIPLVYTLYKILFKPSIMGLILTLSFTAFNVNLLYFLYHNFAGQIIFWGFDMILFISFAGLLKRKNRQTNIIYESLFIGFILGVLYQTYNESGIFVIIPLVLYLMIKTILNLKLIRYYLRYSLIFLTMILVSPYAIIHSYSVYSYVINMVNKKVTEIGWPAFRMTSSYANPLEISGLYNLHSFKALPVWFAIISGIVISGIVLWGVVKSRNRLLVIAALIAYLPFYYWKGIYNPNYFFYYRIVVSTLPVLIVIFVGGIICLKINKPIKSVIYLVLVGLLAFSSYKLSGKFFNEHLSIEKSFVSLLSLAKANKYQEIYAESLIVNDKMLWANHNIYYFIKPIKYIYQLSSNDAKYHNLVPDNSLILLSKPTVWYKTPKILIKNIVWENEYYTLGRLCNSDGCLQSRKEDLSRVEIGKSKYEDSLLINGWSMKEPESRWGIGKESTLRLFAKKENYTKLAIEALTLREPQELSVYINNQFIGKQNIKNTWQIYKYNLNNMKIGIVNIKFVFTEIYKPVDLGISQDTRELNANFKMIKLE